MFYETRKPCYGAIARKSRDAAAVLFGLKFGDNFNSSQLSKARLQSSKHTAQSKTEFNAKWGFKVIQGHVFWTQWKAVFELHGSQSMPGHLTYFHYPIQPICCCGKLIQRAPSPTLIFL